MKYCTVEHLNSTR